MPFVRALINRADAPSHCLRIQAGVLPRNRDHGYIDVRKDIGWGSRDDDGTDK